jgi:hypothetical protein
MKTWILTCFTIAMLVACGNKNGGSSGGADGGGTGTGGDGGSTGGDGGGTGTIDAPPSCTSAGTQCSNCIDDDGDGKIDGFDPECTGLLDNDEATFGTAIPGDNIDPIQQDCFFDGNSGGGDDGCNVHVCCLLGAKTQADCPADLQPNKYNPADCPPPIGTKPLSQMCIDVCGKLTPPGCDCFGCCTICNSTGCYDIDINPAVSPNCTTDTLADPTICKQCIQVTTCGNTTCGDTSCILCPGQDPSTLPASCGGMTTCPTGTTACSSDGTCGEGLYCSNGCCIGVIL